MEYSLNKTIYKYDICFRSLDQNAHHAHMVNKIHVCLNNKLKLTLTYFNIIYGDQVSASGPLVYRFLITDNTV